MIETLALETFSHLLPPNITFKTKFLLAFMLNNSVIILVLLLLFKVVGWLKKTEAMKRDAVESRKEPHNDHEDSGIFRTGTIGRRDHERQSQHLNTLGSQY
jgi:hypothetical protein